MGQSLVEDLRAEQLSIYRSSPKEIRSHYHRERSALDAYRGRQIFELLQNADDAGLGQASPVRVRISLEGDHLVVANTGSPFTAEGIESLVRSDDSPKLLGHERTIGRKGLGFRSVLTWTDRPLVASGPYAVSFGVDAARESALELAREVPSIGHVLQQYQDSQGVLPVPVMRFPSCPGEDDPRLTLARSLQVAGYATVVVLPLIAPRDGQDVREEIEIQLDELAPEAVLFCRYIEEVVIHARARTVWKFARPPRQPPMNGAPEDVIISGVSRLGKTTGTPSRWRVYRRGGSLTACDRASQMSNDSQYEMAVAVPEGDIHSRSTHTLCVYFPTEVRLPLGVLVHATLHTDDSRKHLTADPANHEVLTNLASFLADVLEVETTEANPTRGLGLLRGIETASPELDKPVPFTSAVRSAVRMRKIFPRYDGTLATVEGVRRAPNFSWDEIADRAVFHDTLDERSLRPCTTLLDVLDVAMLQPADLSVRLERLVAQMDARRAGAVIGNLVKGGALAGIPRPSVLRDADGSALPSTSHVFLPPEGAELRLPAWVRVRRVLHADFFAGLKEGLAARTAREVRDGLQTLGYEVSEFQVQQVAAFLVKEAAEQRKLDPTASVATQQSLLRALFDLYHNQPSSAAPDASVHVVTTRGSLRPAGSCYLGPAYAGGRLVVALYEVIGEDEFVAGPAELGIDADADQVESFLLRLGAASLPRATRRGRGDLPDELALALAEGALHTLAYPNVQLGQQFNSYETLRASFADIYVEQVPLPDRFDRLAAESPPEALVAYLVTDAGRAAADESTVQGNWFGIGLGKRKPAYYPLPVPNAVPWILRHTAWVPTSLGRRPPPEVVLSSRSVRALGGLLASPAWNAGARAPRIDPLEANALAGRYGASPDLRGLRAEALYNLLKRMPEADPEGTQAQPLYRAILDSEDFERDPALLVDFSSTGRLWGRKGEAEAYFPVNSLRYASSASVPAPVRACVPLVAIDARRSSRDVEDILGVRPLRREDYSLNVDSTRTKENAWSSTLSEHVRECLPYLYAWRRTRSGDTDQRERRRLQELVVHSCDTVELVLTLGGSGESTVSITEDGEGFTDGSVVWFCSATNPMASADPALWHGLGDLLCEVLGLQAQGAAEFANLLMCDGTTSRRRMLGRMVGGKAVELLEAARADLKLPPGDEEEPRVLPPAPAATPSTEPKSPIPSVPLVTMPSGTQQIVPGTSNDPAAAPEAAAEPPLRSREAAPPLVLPTQRRRVVVSRGGGGGIRLISWSDPGEAERVARDFEEEHGRHPVPVDHIRGLQAYGCDILSFATAELAHAVAAGEPFSLRDVVRFIEVKGRSDPTGRLTLTENEERCCRSEETSSRYYIYRVRATNEARTEFQLAELLDPWNSGARVVIHAFEFSNRGDIRWWDIGPG